MSDSTGMDSADSDGNAAAAKADAKAGGGASGKTTGRAKPAVSARRRARQAALQGLYQWLLNREDVGVIQAHVETHEVFPGCDRKHFEMLLQGCIDDAMSLEAAVTPHLDRPLAELSPVERAVLLVGTFELARCLDIPYRVVINEAVELAKSFGGTDGHKYVNGVLDKTAARLRAVEVQAARAQSR